MHENQNVPAVVRFGPFTLDGRSGELRNGPTRLKVPDQSIAVLQALLERPGELVTREALRDRLWGPDTFVDFEAGLNAAVRRLREALNDSADIPRYVETLPRRGYRFIGPLEGRRSRRVTPPPLKLRRTSRRAPWLRFPCGLRQSGPTSSRAACRAGNPRACDHRRRTLVRIDTEQCRARRGKAGAHHQLPGIGAGSGDLSHRDLRRLRLGGRGRRQLRHLRPIDRRQLSAATDDQCRGRPCSRRGRPTDNGLRSSVSWMESERLSFCRRSAVPSSRCSRPGRNWGAGFTSRRMGSRGRRTASTWSSAIGLAPVPRRRSTCTRSRMVRDASSHVRPRISATFTRSFLRTADISLSFARTRRPFDGSGSVFVHKLEQLQVAGEPVQLTFGQSVAAFDWTRDSRSVIHDGGNVRPGLWRVAVAGGAPEPVLPNTRAARPSVARSGADVIVYQNALVDSNIWELPTPSSPNRQPSGDATYRAIASTFADTDMRFSPDGTRVAFSSRRSGYSALWVSNRDGSRALRLTNFEDGRVGSPCFSADGKWIAFDAIRPGGSWNLYLVPADGGPVKPLTSDAFNNTRPSWSLDGRWIYFASDRTGDWQIWKMPSAGGKPEQITRGAEGSRSSHGTADASTTPSRRLSRASGRSRPREARKFRSSPGAGR